MGEFIDTTELRGSRFERVDLSGSQFRAVVLANTRFLGVNMDGVVIRGAELADVDIHGEIGKVVINGVEIGPLVEAELNRRYPERVKMRPTDPAGYREAWEILERLWSGTVERASRLEPRLLHESVDGEWSFIETLRRGSGGPSSEIPRRGIRWICPGTRCGTARARRAIGRRGRRWRPSSNCAGTGRPPCGS